MRRILITGMSAVGKSSVVEELTRRGYKDVDLNSPNADPTAGWWRSARSCRSRTVSDMRVS